MKILQFPIVRITFWFVLGIITAYYSNPNALLGFVLLGITSIFFGFVYIQSKDKFDQNPFFGATLYAVLFSIGITATIVHNDRFTKNHYIHSESNFNTPCLITATVVEKLKNTHSNNRYIAKITEINSLKSSGKFLLHLKKDSISNDFSVGTKLQIEDQLTHHFKPNNPNQFDYGNYLETKGVYAQVFTEKSQLKISPIIEKSIGYYTSSFRNKIIQNLERSGFKKEELAVVSALILGQQQDISPEVLRDYQYAGAVHILSVSGLHVGFILFFITFLLKPLPKNKFGNITRLVIVIVALWLFALVAGLAPSVVRSAAMFSFLAVGMFLNRETNVFHTTFVSLFLILLVEPLFLFDIGFQLSYIALFFILWLQPMLKKTWTPKNKISTYLWDIFTVSCAAQIGAMPLSIYYFHQFPGLFFVTNLILIPCLSVIMAIGVLLMLLAYFNLIPVFLSKMVELSITFTNTYIKWIASIETFVIKNIPLSFALLLASYLLIFTWIIWFKKPSFTKMRLGLISVLIFQIVFVATHWREQSKKEFIVFNAKQNTILAERIGQKVTLYSKDSLTENSFEKRMVQSYVTANFCTLKEPTFLTNTAFFNSTKILIIDKTSVYNTSIKPDVIILRDSPKVNLERLLLTIKPKLIIADASNYKSYVSAWKRTCTTEKIPFHSTYEKGFYKL